MNNFITSYQHCQDEQLILTGESVCVGVLPNIIIFPEGEGKQIVLDLLKSDLILSYKGHYKLIRCPSCETVSSPYSFIAKDKNNNILYECKFNCEKCGTQLKPTKMPLTRFRCQACGQKSLVAEPTVVCVD